MIFMLSNVTDHALFTTVRRFAGTEQAMMVEDLPVSLVRMQISAADDTQLYMTLLRIRLCLWVILFLSRSIASPLTAFSSQHP